MEYTSNKQTGVRKRDLAIVNSRNPKKEGMLRDIKTLEALESREQWVKIGTIWNLPPAAPTACHRSVSWPEKNKLV